MANLKTEVEQNIARYAGAVLVNRALCDSRDMLKPAARVLIYSQIVTSKNFPNKPYMKCGRIVGDAIGHWYTHGDASCYGIYARLSKPFAMRYVLEDFHGNYGTLEKTGNEAASRYTEIRLSPLGNMLFNDIEKDTVDVWESNFDETEEYPRVATSKGFYNIVNGSTGIGYGAASQIPQFNLREVNEALIKLLWNPEIDDREIICMPDFATGGILLNRDEVIESLLKGNGKACKLRSVVDYDGKRRAFKITEIPYGVYTETIRNEIKDLVNNNPDIGIEGFNDMSARTADIEIYLSKNANPDKILKLLFKETSLEYYSGINITMLDNGRVPKVFTWKEALQSYINHQILVYTRGFSYDLKKINKRLPIVDGLIKATSILDEVIALIRGAADSANASRGLQSVFHFSEEQAKAILDIKLSRLTHLDITKLTNEQADLTKEKKRLEDILADENKLKAVIEQDLRETANKYGDDRRTKILNLTSDSNDEEIERKQLAISVTNLGAIFATETSTLYTQKRNGVGSKFKLEKGEYIINSLIGDTSDRIIFFTSRGNMYSEKLNELTIDDKTYIPAISGEHIVSAMVFNKENEKKYLVIVTKNGLIKKSLVNEYNMARNAGVKAINLDSGDSIISAFLIDTENIGIMSKEGHFILIPSADIRPIGRVAKGVGGMKLNANDYVTSAKPVPASTKFIFSIAEDASCKKTTIDEFKLTGRNTKGTKVQKAEKMAEFAPITNNSCDILITSETAQIRVSLKDISELGREAQGTKAIKLAENSKVIGISIV